MDDFTSGFGDTSNLDTSSFSFANELGPDISSVDSTPALVVAVPMTSELPVGGQDTTPVPGVNGPSKPTSISDVFGTIKSGADSLLGAFKDVKQFQVAQQSIDTQSAIQKAQLATQATQASSAAQIAQAQASGSAEVARLQAEAAIAKAKNAATSAVSGVGATILSIPKDKLTLYIGLAGLAFTAYQIFGKKK